MRILRAFVNPLFADAADIIAAAAAWFVLVVCATGAGTMLFHWLYLVPKQRKAIGAIRFRLALHSGASAREKGMWPAMLWSGGYSLVGVLCFVVLADKADFKDYSMLLFFVGTGCILGWQRGRRDRLRWLGTIGALLGLVLVVLMIAVVVSGEEIESLAWPVNPRLFLVSMGSCLLIIAPFLLGEVFGRTLVRKGGLDLPGRIIPWNCVKRFRWYPNGDDYDLVVAVVPLPGGWAQRFHGSKESELLIPVPAAQKEELDALLTEQVAT